MKNTWKLMLITLLLMLSMLFLTGCEPSEPNEYVWRFCETCRGSGEVFDRGWRRCRPCNGLGQRVTIVRPR